MEKEHDFLMTMLANPGDITIGEYKEAGYTPENTGLALESVYTNSEKIQNNPYFKKEDGSFDKNKFHNFYNNILANYNLLTDDTYVDDLKKHTLYDSHNIFAKWEDTNQNTPKFQLVKAFNPDRQTYSMNRIGQQGPRMWSMDEIAQTLLIEDWNTKQKLESPNEMGFFGNFFDTMVLATWDYDADENGNPTDDPEKIVYQKGTPKLNENGTYYYETLGGRSIYGKQVLNRANILTTDGSALNKYDFFDTDDIKEKSFTGSVMRLAALVGTMFIPYIGPIITGASVAIQFADLFATAGKMIVGTDNSTLNLLEGWTKSMSREGRTEESQLNMWTLENMIGLIGDVAGLLKEQRFIFKYAPFWRTKGFNAKTQEAFKNAVKKSTLEDFLSNRDAITVLKEKDAALKLLTAEEIAEVRAARALTEYLKTSGKIGSVISKGYMTGITVADTYGEALLAGANQLEAALLTIGYAIAEAALLNTDIGEWVLPELKANKIRQRALAEALANVKAGGSFASTSLRALSGETKTQTAKRLIKAGWEAGERNARSLLTRKGAGKYIASSLSSGLGEATEEVTEELLADFSKQCFNWIKGENTFENPWENWQERYLMAGLGGFMGGTLTALGTDFSKDSLIKHDFTFNQAMQEAIWMVRNGEDGKFLKDLNKYKLGSKDLSTKTDETGNYLPGTTHDNQDLAVKRAIANNFELIHKILETQGAKLSDESFFSQITGEDLKDLKMQLLSSALQRTGAAGKLLQRYNSLLAEIVSLSTPTTEKTDTQKLKEKKEGEEEDTKRKEQLKAKELELQDLLSGKNIGTYFENALFELSIGINEAFANDVVTFRGYVEYKTGKPLEELSESERQTYTKEYVEYAKGQRADDIEMRARMYHEAALKASEALKKGESFFANLVHSSDGAITTSLLNDRSLIFTRALEAATSDPLELLTIAQDLIANEVGSAFSSAAAVTTPVLVTETPSSHLRDLAIKLREALALPEDTEDLIKYRKDMITLAATDVILESMGTIISPYLSGKLEFVHPEVKEQLELLITTYDKFRKTLRWNKLITILEEALTSGKLTDFSNNDIYDNKTGLENAIRTLFGAHLNPSDGSLQTLGETSALHLAMNSDDPIDTLLTLIGVKEAMGTESTVPVNTPDTSEYYSGNIILSAPGRILDEIEANGLSTESTRALEKLLIDLVENETEGTIAQRDTVNFWRTTLDNLQYTPIVEMLKDFIVTNDLLNKSAKDVYLSALSKVQEFKEDISLITLTPDETYALEQTLKLATLFKTAIFGARTDKGDLTNLWGGYNATINKFHKREQGYLPLAEIQYDAADYMGLDMDLVVLRIQLLLGIHTANATSKLNTQSKVAVNLYKLIAVLMRSKLMDVALPDDLKNPEYDQLCEAIEKATTLNNVEVGNPPNLSEELKIQIEKEMLDILDAWFNYFPTIKDKLPLFLKNFKLDQDVTSTDETSKYISDTAFVWWLAARAGVLATDFYTKYKETITDDIASLSLQESGTYMCYAFTNAKDIFNLFAEAWKLVLKDAWNNGGWDKFITDSGLSQEDVKNFGDKYKDTGYMMFSDIPIFRRLLLAQGIAGSGKTKGVLSSYIKMLQATNPDILNHTWVVAPRKTASSESTLAENLGLTNVKQFTHQSLLEQVLVTPHTYSNSDQLEMTIGEELEITSDGSVLSKGELLLFAPGTAPKLIIIDEIGKYNYELLSAINKFAELYDVQVITLGDLALTTPRGEVVLETKENGKPLAAQLEPLAKCFVLTQKMGISMRTDNTYMGTMVLTLHLKIESQEIASVSFKYTENDKGLFGVKVFAGTPDTSTTDLKYTDLQLKAIYDNLISLTKTLKSGEKIGFIYTSTNSPLYQAIVNPSGKYYNPDLVSKLDLYEGTAQGFENLYFLAELYSLDVSDETYLSNLYTDISRAKLGAIVITPVAREHELNLLNSPIKSKIKNIESTFSSEPPEADRYTKEGVANYSKNRKKVLEAALQGRTSSTSTGTTPPAGPTPPSTPPAGPSSPTGPSAGGTPSGGSTSTGGTLSTSLTVQLHNRGFVPNVNISVNGSTILLSSIDDTLVVGTYPNGGPYIEKTDVFLGKVQAGEITLSSSTPTPSTPIEMYNDLIGKGYTTGADIRLGDLLGRITSIDESEIIIQPDSGKPALKFPIADFYKVVAKGNNYLLVTAEQLKQVRAGLIKGARILDNDEVVVILDINDYNISLSDNSSNIQLMNMGDFWLEWGNRFKSASTEIPDTSLTEDEEYSSPDPETLVLNDGQLQERLTPLDDKIDDFIQETPTSEPSPSGYSFNTFYPGRAISNGKWIPLSSLEEQAIAKARREGINGLEWIRYSKPWIDSKGKEQKGLSLKDGKSLDDVNDVINVLRKIQLIMLSNRDDKSSAVKRVLTELFFEKPLGNLTIKYYFKSSARPNKAGKKYGTPTTSEGTSKYWGYDYSEDEELLFNPSVEYEETDPQTVDNALVKLPRKRISAFIYLDNDLALEVPLLTIGNPLTIILNSTYYSALLPKLNKLITDNPNNIDTIVTTMLEYISKLPNKNRYTNIFKLLLLFRKTNNDICELDEGVIADHMYTGILYAGIRGKHQIKNNLKYNTFKTIGEMKLYGLKTSTVRVSTTDIIVDGKVVIKKGHPYVLVSYTLDTLDILHLKSNPKEIMAVQVIPPKVTAKQYLDNVIAVMQNAPNKRKDIGDRYTIVKVWQELSKALNPRPTLPYISSHLKMLEKVDEIIKNITDENLSAKQKLSLLSAVENFSEFDPTLSKEITAEQFLVRALYEVFLHTPLYARNKNNPHTEEQELREFAEKVINGVDIYLRIKKDKASIGQECPVTNMKVEEVRIHGKVDPPLYNLGEAILQIFAHYSIPGPSGNYLKFDPNNKGKTPPYPSTLKSGKPVQSEVMTKTNLLANMHHPDLRQSIMEIGKAIDVNPGTKSFEDEFTERYNLGNYDYKTFVYNGRRSFVHKTNDSLIRSVTVNDDTLTVTTEDGNTYSGTLIPNSNLIELRKEGSAGTSKQEGITKLELINNTIGENLEPLLENESDEALITIQGDRIAVNGQTLEGIVEGDFTEEDWQSLMNLIKGLKQQAEDNNTCKPFTITLL